MGGDTSSPVTDWSPKISYRVIGTPGSSPVNSLPVHVTLPDDSRGPIHTTMEATNCGR